MGKVYSFTQLNCQLRSYQPQQTLGCIADTSYLIALMYDLDPFHEEAVRFFDLLVANGFSLYSTVTTRAEYLERHRRILLSEALMGLRSNPTLELGREIRAELTNLKKWIDSQIANNKTPVPSDRELKRIKLLLSKPGTLKKNPWVEMCQSDLKGALTKAWNELVNDVGVIHIELGEKETQELIIEKVTWEKACAISEGTGIGLYDAMILNMLYCSKIPVVASTDLDFGFAMATLSSDKTTLLPERLTDKLNDFL